MNARALQRAFLGLALAAAWPAFAQNARLPYHEIFSIQKAQAELRLAHTNLALELQLRSVLPNVKGSNVTAFIDSKSGKIPVVMGTEGAFSVPVTQDLLVEDPWIVVNQPRGTMELNWHAGLSAGMAQQFTNAVHYAPIMRAVRDCDAVQEQMRHYFPGAPRLSMIGVRLTFRHSAAPPSLVIHAKSGDRKLTADDNGELVIPLDGDLIDEDPVMTLTASPVEVEVVSHKVEE